MDHRKFEAGYAAYRAGDFDRAAECFSGDDDHSQIALAYVCMNRTDGRADPGRAFEILRDLAERGDPIACTDLGFCLFYGVGCRPDEERAFFW